MTNTILQDGREVRVNDQRYALDLFAPGDESEHLITRLGFSAPVDDYDAVLRQLVEAEVGAAVDQRLDEGDR